MYTRDELHFVGSEALRNIFKNYYTENKTGAMTFSTPKYVSVKLEIIRRNEEHVTW